MTTITDDIDLIDITPDADEAELIALFETLTNKTLYPAQSERIMLSIIAYRSNKIDKWKKEQVSEKQPKNYYVC